MVDEFREAHENGIRRVSGGDKHVIGNTVELSGQHKSGRLIPVELSLSTWETAGERCFGGIIRDISKRKAQLKGFNLAIDFDQLTYADKLYAREMLQKAMAKLEPEAGE